MRRSRASSKPLTASTTAPCSGIDYACRCFPSTPPARVVRTPWISSATTPSSVIGNPPLQVSSSAITRSSIPWARFCGRQASATQWSRHTYVSCVRRLLPRAAGHGSPNPRTTSSMHGVVTTIVALTWRVCHQLATGGGMLRPHCPL